MLDLLDIIMENIHVPRFCHKTSTSEISLKTALFFCGKKDIHSKFVVNAKYTDSYSFNLKLAPLVRVLKTSFKFFLIKICTSFYNQK